MAKFIMIDSSCWIKFFRNSNIEVADKVQYYIEKDSACICGIVELEIMQGIRSNRQLNLVKDLFSIIKYYDIQRSDFINSGNRIRNLRQEGITLAPSDVIIAEICIRNSLDLFTLDQDFSFIEELSLKKLLD